MPKTVSNNSDSIGMAVTEIISRYTRKSIALDSEIYLDLGIYGDDLYEIFDELIDIYGSDYSNFDVSKIAPGEGGALFSWIAINIGFRKYESFTVEDLIKMTIHGITVTGAETPKLTPLTLRISCQLWLDFHAWFCPVPRTM